MAAGLRVLPVTNDQLRDPEELVEVIWSMLEPGVR